MDEHLARIAQNEDDLRRDLPQAERLVVGTYTRLRDNLQGIWTSDGGRFHSASEAASGLEKWEDKD